MDKEELRKKTCCILGHQMLIPGDDQKLLVKADNRLWPLITAGVLYYGVGCSAGFSLLMAEHLLDIRDTRCKKLRVIAVLPFPGWDQRWPDSERRRVEDVIRRCNKVVYCSQEYSVGVYWARDKHLIEGSSCCIAYCSKPSGSTTEVVRYAKAAGLRVYNIGNTAVAGV